MKKDIFLPLQVAFTGHPLICFLGQLSQIADTREEPMLSLKSWYGNGDFSQGSGESWLLLRTTTNKKDSQFALKLGLT
jgi:hypothetical protein